MKILCSYDTNMIKLCDNILYRGRRDFEFVKLEGRYQGEPTPMVVPSSFGTRIFIDHIKPKNC
jgi:hypothetical protein